MPHFRAGLLIISLMTEESLTFSKEGEETGDVVTAGLGLTADIKMTILIF